MITIKFKDGREVQAEGIMGMLVGVDMENQNIVTDYTSDDTDYLNTFAVLEGNFSSEELVVYLADLVRDTAAAIDCKTGNGDSRLVEKVLEELK